MKRIFWIVLAIIIVIGASILFLKNDNPNAAYIHNEGKAQGTYYSATYQQPQGVDLQPQIEKLFHDFDLSLSTYNPNSIISRINKNDTTVRTDEHFETLFNVAQEISEITDGAFDMTVAPLVNAWGFGFGSHDRKHTPDVEKILPLIGYKKVKLENHRIIKENPSIMLDASAIAQGYSSDLIAELFEKNGCKNYMIDIGGEIVCKGLNPKSKLWQIGVDKPIDDPENSSPQLQTILKLTDVGLTTSGNYRQFYYKDGKKYAHTINPKTGYPVEHNLLSATVVAKNSTLADAYATSCMVLGVDSAMALCNRIPEIDCYLIYTDKNGKYQVCYTDGFKKYLSE